jgi:hypothetical protein
MHFQRKETEPDELAREQLFQPRRVVFRDVSYRDVLKIQSVLPAQGGALAGNTLQLGDAAGMASPLYSPHPLWVEGNRRGQKARSRQGSAFQQQHQEADQPLSRSLSTWTAG